MNILESINHKGYTVNIYRDDDPLNPRTDWDNLGTFYTTHRSYCPEMEFHDHFEQDEVFGEKPGNFHQSFLEKNIALPVYLYDHSGQTISTTPFDCPWDSGLFGIISVTIEEAKKEYGWRNLTKKRRKQIEEILLSEVNTYDNYMTGEVYRYKIVETGNEENEVDSCGSFFGDDGLEYLKEEAISVIDAHIKWEKIQNLKLFGRQLLIPFLEFSELGEENQFIMQTN